MFYLVITSFYEISLYNSLYIFNVAELFVDLRSRIRFCGSLSVSRFGRIIDPEAENENYEDALEHSYFFLSRLFLLPSSPEIRARLLATPRIAGERLSLRDDLLRVLSLAFLVSPKLSFSRISPSNASTSIITTSSYSSAVEPACLTTTAPLSLSLQRRRRPPKQ